MSNTPHASPPQKMARKALEEVVDASVISLLLNFPRFLAIPAILAIFRSPIRLQQLLCVLARSLRQLLAAQHARNLFRLLGWRQSADKSLRPSPGLAFFDQIMMVGE